MTDRRPRRRHKVWAPPDAADLRQLGEELVREHRLLESTAELFYPRTDHEVTSLTKPAENACLESLLMRTRSLLDFYWRGPDNRAAARPTDAFAEDFFLGVRPEPERAREKWRAIRAPATEFFDDWDRDGRTRVNTEIAHLGYNRLVSAPPEERWWTWSYAWAITSVSARLFFDHVHDAELGERGRTVLRPWFASAPTDDVLEQLRYFVRKGAFPRDFGR